MDIDLLSKMVKELILDNDRVVLPGLGSFVAEVVPSTFSDKGYTINPPYRRLFFRSKPDEGDELAAFYASTNNVDKAMAERIIKDFVAELKPMLHTKKTIVFPGLGRLRATKENAIFFVANEDLDIYPAGFGLEPISLKTHQETKEEVSAAVAGLKSLLGETVPEKTAQSVKLEPEPVAKPEPVAEPEPVQSVEPVKVQETLVEPEPEPVPEPVVTPEPVQEPEAKQEPVKEPAQVPLPETIAVPESKQPVKPEPIVTPKPEPAAEPKKKSGKPALVALCVIAALAVLFLIALAVVGRMSPEWVDQFLYSPEELRILNHVVK
jgi:nucleoid DNA-binding protein